MRQERSYPRGSKSNASDVLDDVMACSMAFRGLKRRWLTQQEKVSEVEPIFACFLVCSEQKAVYCAGSQGHYPHSRDHVNIENGIVVPTYR